MKNKIVLLPILLASGIAFTGCKPGQDATSGEGQPASAASAAKATQPSGPVELTLKWPVGAHYTQVMDIHQQVETSMAGMPQTMKQEVAMSQEFGLAVVAERPEGGREVEMDFQSIQMTVNAGGREVVHFDSHGESLDGNKNPMAAVFKNLVGTRIKYILDASNQVERLEGLQEFRNKVLKNSPAQARSSMAQMMSEDYFKQMINLGQGLPNKPVSPGDSWPVKTEVAMGPIGIMQLDLQYVFKGYEQHAQRECARLEFDGMVKSKPDRAANNPNMKMTIEDGTTTGHTWFDVDLGMVIGAEINQKMNMSIELTASPGAPGGAGGQKAPQTKTMSTALDQDITITITPDTESK